MTESSRLFVGIDPGKAGGIALVDGLGLVLEAHKMPETDRDLLECLQAITLRHSIGVRAVVERVSSSPQMGVVSAFTFGKGYGAILMALASVWMPFDLVAPVTWQTAMGCRTAGDKNVSKRRAQQLFPSSKVTHAIADALLLAEYCRRYWRVGDPRKEDTNGKEGSQNAGTKEAHGGGGATAEGSYQDLYVKAKRAEPKTGATIARPAGHGAGAKPRAR